MNGRGSMQKNILLVEDDREISKLITSHLIKENFSVHIAFDGEEALTIFEKEVIDLILLDSKVKWNGSFKAGKRNKLSSSIDHFSKGE
jgi:DNA-binding response OmpR family regulator